MCNENVRDEIVLALCQRNEVVSESASISELRGLLGLACSNSQFKKALGSAVEHGWVHRHRKQPEFNGDDQRPISLRPTWRGRLLFAGSGKLRPAKVSANTYFAS